MKDILNGIEAFTLVLPIILGITAAVAQLCKHGWLGLSHFIRELVLCCFYGVLIFWMMDLWNLPPTVNAAITGGGSYALLNLGNTIFAKLERMINEFQISDILDYVPWLRKNGKNKDE